MRGGAHNLKHHELNQYYNEFLGPKVSYTTFLGRCLRYGYDKNIAIQKYVKLKGKHLIKGEVKTNGRECTKCKKFKEWAYFYKSKTGVNGRTGVCAECIIKYKKEFRKVTNSASDREYKKKTRTLLIGQIIHFGIVKIEGVIQPMEYRKVVDKKKMQAYKLKSMNTGYFCRLDTTEGNPNYKKFYHVDNLTISKEIKNKELCRRLQSGDP